MARTSSQPYKDGPKELRITQATLDRRWIDLSQQFRTQLELGLSDLKVEAEYASDIVAAGFVGRACEHAERHQGRMAVVAPLSWIRGGPLRSWLGFHEAWERVTAQKYIFHHVGLTVHIGYEGELSKPQIFRSEWPGFRRWVGGVSDFQSPGAGHPHWQFDAIRVLRESNVRFRDKSLEELRGNVAPVEFDPGQLSREIITAVETVGLERIHFASAAPWWFSAPADAPAVHANAPADAGDIIRWVIGCVAYIRQELRHC